MVLVEEVLGFRFDEGNGEDEEDEETEEIEENEESVTGSGDFTSGDEYTIVSVIIFYMCSTHEAAYPCY